MENATKVEDFPLEVALEIMAEEGKLLWEKEADGDLWMHRMNSALSVGLT